MSTKNKKSVAAQALLEMDEITSAIKEESKKSLKSMLAEAAKEALREACEDEDEDKDYEVIDGEQNDAEDDESDSDNSAKSDVDEDENTDMENGVPAQGPEQQVPAEPQVADMGAQEAPEGDAGMQGGEPVDAAAAGEGEGEYGWDDASKYQVGNDTYDLTGENDYDSVVKVYKLLKDDDQVVVKKDGNTIQLQDGNAGTEYVIDLGSDDEDASAEAVDGEEENPEAGLNEEFGGIAGFIDDEEDDIDDGGFDVEDDSRPWDDDDDESIEDKIDRLQQQLDALKGGQAEEPAYAGINENKKSRKPMKESKEVLFEVDLGYTDNYQDKDPIAGLSNNEPSKSGKSWHKGVPTGTSKPWAGQTKSKGDPFKETKKVEGSVNEEEMIPDMGEEAGLEEANLSQSRWNDTHANGNRIPAANGDEYRRKGMQKTHKGNEYRATSATNESKELKAVKKQNKELKEAILTLRKNLNEAYITNVNLGKITKLFLENTTSLNEKHEIVNRFANEAKTVEQATALYESISKELKKNTNSMNITESKTANGTKALNEEKVYKSNDLLKTIDLMKRMGNC